MAPPALPVVSGTYRYDVDWTTAPVCDGDDWLSDDSVEINSNAERVRFVFLNECDTPEINTVFFSTSLGFYYEEPGSPISSATRKQRFLPEEIESIKSLIQGALECAKTLEGNAKKKEGLDLILTAITEQAAVAHAL